jgi:hypothetical protein
MPRRVLLLAAALLTGCANSPTAATREKMPVRLDAGGGWVGSGNYTEPGTPAVGDSANTTGAGRGGGSFGSGN